FIKYLVLRSKSERLNALRKQYDSFLDEDKKRKERNEFILGRLEKMRLYTPAVVPVRYNMGNPQISKYNFLTQERPEYHRKIRFDDTPILPSRQISVPAVCVTKDEETILQEISKKYILIPKLRFTSENNVMIHNPSSANNDADWRKKYNILDELKKIEKEGSSEISMDQPDKPYDNFKNDHEFNIAASNNIREQQKQNINRDPVLHTSQNDEHVSKLKTNKTKTARIDDLNYNVDCKPLLENKQTKISNIAASSDYENEVVCEPDLDINIEQNHITDSNELSKELYPHENVIKAEQKNENINKDKLPYSQVQNIQENEFKISDNLVPKKKDIENIKSEFDTENDTPDLENSKIHDSNFAVELNEKGNTEHNLNKDEIVVPPVETVKNQEPYLVVSPKEHDTENIQQQQYEPKGETSNISDNNIPSQIDDFEAEQKEMFYSEETNYNQNVDRAGNNTQNEEYTNEQYSYYNESQQDQPYYSEINEHEESTERYDPNYQPQYVGNYEENVNDAHYDNQQYEGDIFENQQDVTNVNYEQRPDQQEVLN
ncbi:jg4277, partial [Pararge aegeria aegeria]